MHEKTAVDLFTPEEHQILSQWLDLEPPGGASLPSIDQALARLGFEHDAECSYTKLDAAVAFIVLEAVEHRLPQWASVADGVVNRARTYRPKEMVPKRLAAMLPQHLFTVNWADSGPGFSWPAAYYTTWVPHYDRFVVTDSGDCPDVFGYADIAVGHFGREEGLEKGSRRIVVETWRDLFEEWNPSRWAYLFFEGLLDSSEAESWADEAWREAS